MNFNLLYRRIRDLISDPAAMWRTVRDENRSIREIRISFLLPLVLLISIAGVAGTMLFTYNGLSLLFPVVVAFKYMVGFTATVEVTALVITEISVVFKTGRSFSNNYKLVVYSFTPFIVTMIITRLFSSLVFLNLAGLYGIYIAWKGIETITDTPPPLRARYTALVFLSTLVFYLSISFILNSLQKGLYFALT